MIEKFIRQEYIDKLLEYRWSPLIKVLTGMRRSGKTEILKQFLEYIKKQYKIKNNQILYINMEYIDFDNIKNYQDLSKHINDNIWEDNLKLLIIDEIQEISWREKYINNLLAKYGSNIQIYISGSNSNLLSSDLATYITGRYIQIYIYPLSMSEYTSSINKKLDKNSLDAYMQNGWLPGTLFFGDNYENINSYNRSVLDSITLKDMVRYYNLRNLSFFEDLIKFIFVNIGNVFSAKSISDYLKSQKIKANVETIMDYLSYCVHSNILHQVKTSDIQSKKTFDIYNKYYVNDLWLRNGLVSWNFARDIWWWLENLIYLELIKSCYNVYIWRIWGFEIDFIASKNNKTIYIQACYKFEWQKTLDREYRGLQMISDNWPKYIVTYEEQNLWVIDGINSICVTDIYDIL